jgi:hypothetical protein
MVQLRHHGGTGSGSVRLWRSLSLLRRPETILDRRGDRGPTWYSEYNVLTGLSARSYGRFAFNVTRIAAGRVRRGLPQALRRCGYKTFSLYPAYGAFLSARKFQTTTGVNHFTDLKQMGATSDMQRSVLFRLRP